MTVRFCRGNKYACMDVKSTSTLPLSLEVMTNPATLSRINERDPLSIFPVDSSTRAIDTHSPIQRIIHLCLGLSFERQQTDNRWHSYLLYKSVVYNTVILLSGIQFLWFLRPILRHSLLFSAEFAPLICPHASLTGSTNPCLLLTSHLLSTKVLSTATSARITALTYLPFSSPLFWCPSATPLVQDGSSCWLPIERGNSGTKTFGSSPSLPIQAVVPCLRV
jgi:hypothetical protein